MSSVTRIDRPTGLGSANDAQLNNAGGGMAGELLWPGGQPVSDAIKMTRTHPGANVFLNATATNSAELSHD